MRMVHPSKLGGLFVKGAAAAACAVLFIVSVVFMAGCEIDDEVAELLAAHGRKGDNFVRPDGGLP